MKTIVMSDLHGYLPDVKTIKEAEVLFVCGDIVPLEIQNDIKKSRIWFYNDFLNWTNSLPVDKVFIIKEVYKNNNASVAAATLRGFMRLLDSLKPNEVL